MKMSYGRASQWLAVTLFENLGDYVNVLVYLTQSDDYESSCTFAVNARVMFTLNVCC